MSRIARPRVLLLEDDAGVRRFVELALETLSLDLVICARLDEALQALASAPVQLVLTDLNLSDGSGLELLQWLHERGGHAFCPSVVLSGGVNGVLRQQLQQLGVWRVLDKPVPVGLLQACVKEALACQDAQTLGHGPSLPAAGTDLVAEFFAGNQSLFDAYRSTCLEQLPKDLQEGDQALRAGDVATLERVAHNLKSALALLGWSYAAELARDTENAAAQAALAPMRANWQRLRQQVRAGLAEHHPGGPP